jgi:hypothetical protein
LQLVIPQTTEYTDVFETVVTAERPVSMKYAVVSLLRGCWLLRATLREPFRLGIIVAESPTPGSSP